MSLLVHQTLRVAADHQSQTNVMLALVQGLKSENIKGLKYSCFATSEPTKFVGLLEFLDEETKEGYLSFASFATYRDAVGPTFANPAQTTEITSIATTR